MINFTVSNKSVGRRILAHPFVCLFMLFTYDLLFAYSRVFFFFFEGEGFISESTWQYKPGLK